MNSFRGTMVLAALLATQGVQAQTATCNNFIGEWVNQRGSLLSIYEINNSNGGIIGTFQANTGGNGRKFPMYGWINYQPVMKDQDNASIISFSVQWEEYGSITAWAGYCKEIQGVPTLTTLWNLVKANAQYDWEHVLAGTDTFRPKVPADYSQRR